MDRKETARILLVDDDENFSLITSNLIALDGHQVDTQTCVEEAHEFLSNHRDTDILLLDIDMGEGPSGLEALPGIVSAYPHLQVIMLTSQTDLKIGIKAMKNGAFDYLVKPYKKEDFDRLVPLALNRKQLSQLNQLYLEMLVHDLKNPLQNITMGLDTLVDPIFEEDKMKAKALNLAKYGTWQIQNMILNILNISKFEKTSFELTYDSFKLLPAINEEMASIISRIQFTDRKFSIKSDLKEDFCISTERGLFFQILGNLFANALRFTSAQEVIRLEINEDKQGQLVLKLTNPGSYIEEELREKIFSKFFKPQYKSGHNFGLGLTFSRLAARLLSGDLYVESKKDPESTSFILIVKNFLI